MARFTPTTINRPPLSASSAGTVVCDVHTTAVTTALAVNDIVVLGKLGAGQILVDAVYGSTDIDTNGTPAVSGTVGILNAAGTDLESGGQIITAADGGQAATVNRMNVATAPLVDASDSDREIGFKCLVKPATAANGTMQLQLFTRSA